MHYDKSTVHPRTDFPQTGWMGKVPLTLLEIHDLANASRPTSYRSREGPSLDVRNHEWFQTGWMGKVPLGLLEVAELYAAAKPTSYRTPDRPLFEVRYTDFPQTSPLGKVPLSLLEVFDLYAAAKPTSFRSPGRRLLELRYHQWEQESPEIWFRTDELQQQPKQYVAVAAQQRLTGNPQGHELLTLPFYEWRPNFEWIAAVIEFQAAGRKRPIAPWVKRLRLVKAKKRI